MHNIEEREWKLFWFQIEILFLYLTSTFKILDEKCRKVKRNLIIHVFIKHKETYITYYGIWRRVV
jgi:hypothetical protein